MRTGDEIRTPSGQTHTLAFSVYGMAVTCGDPMRIFTASTLELVTVASDQTRMAVLAELLCGDPEDPRTIYARERQRRERLMQAAADALMSIEDIY